MIEKVWNILKMKWTWLVKVKRKDSRIILQLPGVEQGSLDQLEVEK